MNPRNFFAELKRRNVYKVAVAYAIVAWLLIQAASILFPTFEAPTWVMKVFVAAIILGFPIALVIAWAVELTPEGLKRTESADADAAPAQRTGNRAWIYVVIIAGAISIGLFFLGRYTASNRTAVAELPAKSIAVLPFENRSEDKANAYFADGIQDEILTRLAKIADLKVIWHTSTQRFRSSPDDLPAIAKQLGVANILDGSVQRSAEQVRVNVQLINASTGAHLWSAIYDRKLTDIFAVESEIATRIADTLQTKLSGREKTAISVIGTKDSEAYDAYLHARALRHEQSRYLRNFLEHSQRAVALDPNFAEAWALLAAAEARKYFYEEHTDAQVVRVRTAAETALRLAPDLADAHSAMGDFYYFCLQDFERALAELNLAHDRAPNDADVLLVIGLVKRRQGNLDDSIAIQLQAAKLDLLNQDIWINLGRSYRGIRNDEARVMFDRALTIAPNDPQITAEKAETYMAQGDLDRAWRLLNNVKVPPATPEFATYVSLIVYRRQFDDAIALVSSTLNEKDASPVLVAVGHNTLGNLFLLKGDKPKAQAFFLRAESELKDIRTKGDSSLVLDDTLIEVEARLGHREKVQRVADALFAKTRKDKWRFPRSEEVVARSFAGLGDVERAMPLLEDALEALGLEALTPALLRFDPFWDPLRNDPRFQKLANAQP